MAETECNVWPEYGILTNLDCNLNCSYCFEHKKSSMVVSKDSCDKYLEFCYHRDYALKKKPKNVYSVIGLIGGESFLHPDIIDHICEKVISLDKQYNITEPSHILLTTNGTLISNPENIKLLKKYKDNIGLGFSIDGTKEVHDSARVDYAGNGSYDRAIEGLKIAQSILPTDKITSKSTFTHATINKYAESVISLIELGITKLAANVVFNEIWREDEAPMLADQLTQVAYYMWSNELLYKVDLEQLNPTLTLFNNEQKRTENYCGTCKYMRTLGFNNEIHGCHRMATDYLPPIGYLKDNEIIITNQELIDRVINQYKLIPQECVDCNISKSCPMCVIEAIGTGNEKEYYSKKPQCGWTIALVAAREYLKLLLTNNTIFVDQ